jgi:Uncharacterized conserved protein (DUF2088).
VGQFTWHTGDMEVKMQKPELIKIRQKFDATCIYDVEAAVLGELKGLGLKLEPGSSIAVTAGSRGIDNIALILKTVVTFLKSADVKPFIVPAMGSHGGATAEGQKKILEELGIRPDYIGAPIMSSMDTVKISSIDTKAFLHSAVTENMPVYIDKYAYEADGILVINRVKPHTSFHGDVESGMMKMIAVGLGKAVQAANIHNHGTKGLKCLIRPIAKEVLATGKVIAGIGIVENAYDKQKTIKAFLPGQIEKGEQAMLAEARMNMPCLPTGMLDLLVVEQMGKNFSGTGMDTNIIGRIKIEGEPEPEKPYIRRIAVLDLSEAARGNAYGIGLADFTTRKLFDKIDYNATYANMLATGFTERVKVPFIAENEEIAIETALKSCSITSTEKARIIRIKNTLQLEYMEVSKNIYEEIKSRVERV